MGSIHTIVWSTFSPLLDYQLVFYKDINKKYSRLSIDAMGSLVKKIKRTSLNLLSADIFVYEAVVNAEFGQLPGSQMISEKFNI